MTSSMSLTSALEDRFRWQWENLVATGCDEIFLGAYLLAHPLLEPV